MFAFFFEKITFSKALIGRAPIFEQMNNNSERNEEEIIR